MFMFKSKKKELSDSNVQLSTTNYSIDDFLIILNKIQELNNKPTQRINNWKLRQQWINNYIDLTIEHITKNNERG